MVVTLTASSTDPTKPTGYRNSDLPWDRSDTTCSGVHFSLRLARISLQANSGY